MGKCDNCRLRKESAKAFDIHWHGEDDCPYDKCPVPDFPKTHADRIRAMTDEELAKWINSLISDCDCNAVPCRAFCKLPCDEAWLKWLKQEATNVN